MIKMDDAIRYLKTVEDRLKRIEYLEMEVKRLNTIVQKLVEGNIDCDVNMTMDIFTTIEQSNSYKKVSLEFKHHHVKLMEENKLDDYIVVLKKDVDRLTTILSKKYSKQKVINTIAEFLSPLQQRLLFFNQFYNTAIDGEEIQRLENLLIKRDECLVYNEKVVLDRLTNYSLALISFKKLFKKAISEKSFGTVCYFGNKDEQGFAFYVLAKIEHNKKLWRMDCRLENIYNIISNSVLKYSIELFRKIYFCVFSDNVYRSNYKQKATICWQDCEQLISNIILLSKQKSLLELLQSVVRTNFYLEKTEFDEFDLINDDKTQRKRFIALKDDQNMVIENISRLFDNISENDSKSIVLDKEDS